MNKDLESWIRSVRPADEAIMNNVRMIWDHKCMPLGSLGEFQEMIVRIAGAEKTVHPHIDRKLTFVMAADNGVVGEGVSQSDHHVTTQVVENMTKDKATIAIMSKFQRSDFRIIDMGMKEHVPGTLDRSLMSGTWNMTKGPAMTYETAEEAIRIGAEEAAEAAAKGYDLFATGEMGIGNTTTSTAVLAAFTGCDVESITGRGAGLSSEGLIRKIQAIRKALEVNKPDPRDPIDVLAKVGGLDLAGLTGIFIGAASAGIPVVIDGFIASVAALAAKRLCPEVTGYMLPSHCSMEPGALKVFDELQLQPVIYGGLRLGEGSGAVLLFAMLDHIMNIYRKLPSFDEAHVETYIPLK